MAAFDTNRPYAATGSAARIGGLFTSAVNTYSAHGTAAGSEGLFTAAFRALNAWNDRRLTRKSLMALTDRELDDIGLHRGDIETVARR